VTINKDLAMPNLYRVIDANLNRLQEGIRVVEDINRYLYNNQTLAIELKTLRHLSKVPYREKLLQTRNTHTDVLKKTIPQELKRENIDDLLISNYKRTQESSRVLEECYKLISVDQSEIFKNIRYTLYELDKKQFLN
jgi:thiamine-phosphate pyrophosphorylase